jgi:hypothetical protein
MNNNNSKPKGKNPSKGKKKAGNKTANKPQQVRMSPLAVNVKSVNKGANIQGSGGVTVVTHREVVQEGLVCTSTFGLGMTIALQPAISTYSRGSPLGTWLPKIATEYDNYEFEKLKLHYIPTCATTQAGLVIMSVDPNPEALPPESFSSMKNARNTVTGPARERLTLDLMPCIGRKKLLTREGPVTSYPIYDAGRAFVGTTAGTDVPVGYVEVEYTIRFSNPQTGPRIDTIVGVADVPMAAAFTGNNVAGAPGTQRWVGTNNAQAWATSYMFDVIHQAPGKLGASPMQNTALVTRSAPLSWTSPATNITYRHTNIANLPLVYWVAPNTGRYKFSALMPADWQNYVTFGAELVSWGTTNLDRNPASDVPNVVYDVARDGTGAIVEVPARYAGWRGFRSTTTGGTDDDDLVPSVDITFTAVAGERISFMVGIRNDTNIAENLEGWFLYDTRSGFPYTSIEYLGSVTA